MNAATGVPTGWNPVATGFVFALAVSGTTIYAAGDFLAIGGQPRSRIAALDDVSGNATTWNPGADDQVLALAVSGNTVYAGEIFLNIGGQARRYIAALDATTATNNATAWNPNPNVGGFVRALAVSGSTIYAGGHFTVIGGFSRNRISALNAAINTNNATAWDPNVAGAGVHALAVSGTTVYAGGNFGLVGIQARRNLAAINANVNTNNATAWSPDPNGFVGAVAATPSAVFAGGSFSITRAQPRNRIAALDLTTGAATAWNPNANATVAALTVNGATVIAGGGFNFIGGQPRIGVAALDAGTGFPIAWIPG